ncbi:site-specific integrase [Paenibacillus polymyxa]|uniref:site-specific integrase n=1 Tax=Paenibacillus polymyxa TaxID=1406 RepID=UPI0032AFC468
MTKINELIEDFRLNQEILGREERYIDLCLFRLYRWEEFTVKVLGVAETEDVTPLHIKKYIQERQRVGKEVNRTINNNIATLKVFFQYLVNEELLMNRIIQCGGLEI